MELEGDEFEDSDEDDTQRTIIHIDVDCFYAQVEMLRDPSLALKPLGIQQKNIVVTCNYVARQRGVGKCQYITEAMKVCPDLVLVNGEDLARYRKVSILVRAIWVGKPRNPRISHYYIAFIIDDEMMMIKVCLFLLSYLENYTRTKIFLLPRFRKKIVVT